MEQEKGELDMTEEFIWHPNPLEMEKENDPSKAKRLLALTTLFVKV